MRRGLRAAEQDEAGLRRWVDTALANAEAGIERPFATIDIETGQVIEFVDPELEALQRQIATRLGFRLVDHRMELFGVKLERKDSEPRE